MISMYPERGRRELEIEYSSAYDDYHECWAGSALNPEYEAYCAEQQEASQRELEWDTAWPEGPASQPEPEAGN